MSKPPPPPWEPPRPPGMPPERTSPPSRIPKGSADYSAALADATAYKLGEISFEELQTRVIARALPPHPLGDAYLMVVPPPPPPGVHFDPLVMPRDWARTWGEIAMTYFAGEITREEYDRLHAAAHPGCSS